MFPVYLIFYCNNYDSQMAIFKHNSYFMLIKDFSFGLLGTTDFLHKVRW